jgi:hypothetical protein
MYRILFILCGMGLLLNVAHAQEASPNYMTVIINPSVNYLDWSTPRRLFKSYIGSEAIKYYKENFKSQTHTFAMGHAVAEVNCTDSTGKRNSYWAAISGQHDRQLDIENIFEKEIGIQVLFESYDDGYIQDSDTVSTMIKQYEGRFVKDADGKRRRLRPHFLRYAVSPKQCDDIMAYYQSFTRIAFGDSRKKDARSMLAPKDKLYFGFLMQPAEQFAEIRSGNSIPDDYKYGGGCTSFMTGFVKVAGVYGDLFENEWIRKLQYTEHLIGGRIDPETGVANKVTIGEIFSQKGAQWVQTGLPVKEQAMYDPELMWRSFDRLLKCVKTDSKDCPEASAAYLSQMGGAALDTMQFEVKRRRMRQNENGKEEFVYYTEKVEIPGINFANAARP